MSTVKMVVNGMPIEKTKPLTERLKQDKDALSMKIADFFIAFGEGKISSVSALFDSYPILYFNDKKSDDFGIYQCFGIEKEDEWAKLYQLFGLETKLAYRVTSAIRELSDKGVNMVLSDEKNGVPEEKKKHLSKLANSGKIGAKSTAYANLLNVINERKAPLLSGDLMDVMEGGEFSVKKTRKIAERKTSQYSRVSFSDGTSAGTMPSKNAHVAILDYMYKHNIPLTDQIYNNFIREYSLGIFKLPEDYAVLRVKRQRGKEKVKRTTIVGRGDKGRSRIPWSELPNFRTWAKQI